MSKIYITQPVFDAIVAIKSAGHGVELECAGGGNSHTNTDITIGVRVPGETAYVAKLVVRFTTSYSQQFNEFVGRSDEFGDLCFYAQHSIDPFIKSVEAMFIQPAIGS